MDPEGSNKRGEEETHTLHRNPTQARHRSLRSLNGLAKRFVRMLQEAEDGRLDIKDAVSILDVGGKRRIYDITNVLEGIGLISKTSKRIVKWTGTIPGQNVLETSKRLIVLKSELKELELKERSLDQQTLWVEQSIRNTTEDCSSLTYVNHEDICNCFTGHTLLAIRAPSGTQLDVPIPKAVQNSPAMYQIHLRSNNGPIDVIFLNKWSSGSVPVVLPVPPSEEILQSAALAMSIEQGSPKETEDLQEAPNKKILGADLIKELMASQVFSPLLSASSPPATNEHLDNLDDSESLHGFFGLPVLDL
ncbi:transcription factor E2F5-like isoform 1-T2 [Aulostomus maculatus]